VSEQNPAERFEGICKLGYIAELPPQSNAFVEPCGTRGIALPAGDASDGGERRSADRALCPRSAQRLGESSSSFGEMRVRQPEPPQGAGQLELAIRIVNCQPLERATEVVVVGFKALRGLGFRVHAMRIALRGQRAKCVCVTATQFVGLP
jgi:hypothetical protein